MKQTALTNKLSTTINPNTGKPPGSRVIDVQPNDVKSCQRFSIVRLNCNTRKLDLMTFWYFTLIWIVQG